MVTFQGLLLKVWTHYTQFYCYFPSTGSKPGFKVFLEDITMFEKKPVIFKCRLSAKNLAFNVTWYKDGEPITDAYRSYKITPYRWGSRLRIRRAKVKDAGIFQCVVKGPGGTVTAQARLKINRLVNAPPSTSMFQLFNHLIPNGDRQLFPPYSITTPSNIQVTRMKNVSMFKQILPARATRNVWRIVGRTRTLILGLR